MHNADTRQKIRTILQYHRLLHENLFSDSRVVTYGQTDEHKTDRRVEANSSTVITSGFQRLGKRTEYWIEYPKPNTKAAVPVAPPQKKEDEGKGFNPYV
jgi:hypothetical protein